MAAFQLLPDLPAASITSRRFFCGAVGGITMSSGASPVRATGTKSVTGS